MIIIGAKGFAKEAFEVIYKNDPSTKLCFYDDISEDLPNLNFGEYKILRTSDEAKDYFENTNKSFVLGLGNPTHRRNLYNFFLDLGGVPKTIVSAKADIGTFEVSIGDGTIITPGCVITNSISIGKGCLINLNSTIGHDTIIGDFVEICPAVNISGNCIIEENTFLGTAAVILPEVKIGKNCIIAAGSVVTKDVPDFSLVAGIPAVIKKDLR